MEKMLAITMDFPSVNVVLSRNSFPRPSAVQFTPPEGQFHRFHLLPHRVISRTSLVLVIPFVPLRTIRSLKLSQRNGIFQLEIINTECELIDPNDL